MPGRISQGHAAVHVHRNDPIVGRGNLGRIAKVVPNIRQRRKARTIRSALRALGHENLAREVAVGRLMHIHAASLVREVILEVRESLVRKAVQKNLYHEVAVARTFQALQNPCHEVAVVRIIQALQNPSLEVAVVRAIQALRNPPHEVAVAHIIQALRNPSQEVPVDRIIRALLEVAVDHRIRNDHAVVLDVQGLREVVVDRTIRAAQEVAAILDLVQTLRSKNVNELC